MYLSSVYQSNTSKQIYKIREKDLEQKLILCILPSQSGYYRIESPAYISEAALP